MDIYRRSYLCVLVLMCACLKEDTEGTAYAFTSKAAMEILGFEGSEPKWLSVTVPW